MSKKLKCYECNGKNVTPIPGQDGTRLGQCEDCGALDEFYLFVMPETKPGGAIVDVKQITVDQMWAAATGENVVADYTEMDREARMVELRTILNTMSANEVLAVDEAAEALLHHLRERIKQAWASHNQHLAFPTWDLEAKK